MQQKQFLKKHTKTTVFIIVGFNAILKGETRGSVFIQDILQH